MKFSWNALFALLPIFAAWLISVHAAQQQFPFNCNVSTPSKTNLQSNCEQSLNCYISNGCSRDCIAKNSAVGDMNTKIFASVEFFVFRRFIRRSLLDFDDEEAHLQLRHHRHIASCTQLAGSTWPRLLADFSTLDAAIFVFRRPPFLVTLDEAMRTSFPPIDAHATLNILARTLVAIQRLHWLGVAHRAVTPRSLFVSRDIFAGGDCVPRTLLFTDLRRAASVGFGAAPFVLPIVGFEDEIAAYVAPELRCDGCDSHEEVNGVGSNAFEAAKAADYFAFGALMFALVNRVPPRSISCVEARLTAATPSERIVPHQSQETWLLMRGLMHADWRRRITDALHVRRHAFFRHVNWQEIERYYA